MTRRFGLSFVGLLAVAGAACAHQHTASSQNPMEARVAASQQQTREALKHAQDAQQKASDQARVAAGARQEVAKAQQALTQAQQKAQTEQQKAEQLQQTANQATQQASRTAQQAQHMTTQQLSEQGRMVERGELSVAGPVSRATKQSVTVETAGQGAMTFRVTDQTRVTIDGRQASAAEIQPGADARVAYQVGGLEPSAKLIQVMTGSPLMHAPPQGGAASQGTGAGGAPSNKATGATGGTGSSGQSTGSKGSGTSGSSTSGTGSSTGSDNSSSPQSTDTQQSPQ